MFWKKTKRDIPPVDPVKPKVIHYSTIKPITCRMCHCTYQGTHAHLKVGYNGSFLGKDFLIMPCPICGENNRVEFDEKEKDDEH